MKKLLSTVLSVGLLFMTLTSISSNMQESSLDLKDAISWFKI